MAEKVPEKVFSLEDMFIAAPLIQQLQAVAEELNIEQTDSARNLIIEVSQVIEQFLLEEFGRACARDIPDIPLMKRCAGMLLRFANPHVVAGYRNHFVACMFAQMPTDSKVPDYPADSGHLRYFHLYSNFQDVTSVGMFKMRIQNFHETLRKLCARETPIIAQVHTFLSMYISPFVHNYSSLASVRCFPTQPTSSAPSSRACFSCNLYSFWKRTWTVSRPRAGGSPPCIWSVWKSPTPRRR